MKNAFRAYYPPTEEELKDLWENGLIILDAGALLVFFRYSASTRDEFLRVLTDKKDSLWLPHQVGLEFHRNRLKVVAEQKQGFERTIKFLTELSDHAHDSISKLNIRRHITLDLEVLDRRLNKRIEKVAADVRKLQKAHRESLKSGADDKILIQIADLYESRLGEPYDKEGLAKLYAEGSDRYDREQPPGYMDRKDKKEPDMYGDLVLWNQILDKGKEAKRPAVFITDDLKEDWWLFVSGERKGPRTELVEEYYEASGKRILFYTPQSFLHFAATQGATVSAQTQDEVKEVSQVKLFFPVAKTDDARTLRELLLEEQLGRTVRTDLQSEVVARRRLRSREIARLEEQQLDLRRRRSAIEHRIALLHDDDVMRDDVMPLFLEQREAVDLELMRLTEDLDALRSEAMGQDRLTERHRHASELGLTQWESFERDAERRADAYWRPMSSEDLQDPGSGPKRPPNLG